MSAPLDSPAPACPYPALPPPVNVRLAVLHEHACPYLPGRLAMMRAFATNQLPPELYHDFMDAAFRRSGTMIYQPICRGCRACTPIRLPVERFKPDKSQRRCWRKNHDLAVTVSEPAATDEKYDLYCRYQLGWHRKPAPDSRAEFEGFLYESPAETLEFCYRDPAGQLLGVGLCDVCSRSLSTVYFYHDPAHRQRGLGNYSALYEIQTARELGLPYYYLGYWVDGCRAMQYKTNFRPFELLHTDGIWRDVDEGGQ